MSGDAWPALRRKITFGVVKRGSDVVGEELELSRKRKKKQL